MSITLSSLPGKFKCSLLNAFFYPDGITPNSGLTGQNNTYIYIYIYIYICVCVCVCVCVRVSTIIVKGTREIVEASPTPQ